jgi:acetyl esterase/lipase
MLATTVLEPLVEMAPWLLLVAGAAFALLTLNALVPLRHPLLMFQSFLAGLAVREAAGHQLLWQLPIAVVLVAFGALRGWPGHLGLALCSIAWAGLVLLFVHAHRDATALRLGRTRDRASRAERAEALRRYPDLHVLMPALAFVRRDIAIDRGIEFCTVEGQCLRLDVFRPRATGRLRPAIVQVHGGAWVSGFKWLQGVPLLGHLAAHGWVGFNVDYRLSPRATFPAHLVDVKRAIAWVRENAETYGIDPSFIVVTGGSAGAHLAALAGLTHDEPRYQPGFEASDTSVAAVVALYGVYDLTESRRPLSRSFRHMLERWVLKVLLREQPEAFAAASPIERVRPDAPPFYVVHGAVDTVAPISEARAFAERLREVSGSPVVFLEVPGAGHAFDMVPSLRTGATVEAIAELLEDLHRQHVARANAPTACQ